MKKLLLLNLLIVTTTILVAQTNQSNYRNWVRTNTSNDKLALVIGNSKYLKGSSLSEPANDAALIAKALKARGYDVVLGYNLDQESFYGAVQDFAEKFPAYKEGVFYFAGHGFQVEGQNYLVPTDANPKGAWQVSGHCINVKNILEAINQPTIPKLILVDACRNNPFSKNWTDAKKRNLTPGMKAVAALKNSLVVFSTAENTQVSDYNQFAEIMARQIGIGGCISDILGKVDAELSGIDVNQVIRPTGLLQRQICFGNPVDIKKPRQQVNVDSDGDGLLNSVDECPDDPGPIENKGCPVPISGTFIDDRDGQSYSWKKMKDGRKWMTQNLNYETSDSYCYDDDERNCREYGRLYTWYAAQNICPSGWRLPSGHEWKSLFIAYGGCKTGIINNTKEIGNSRISYDALISGGSSGFEALLGGTRWEGDGLVYFNLNGFGFYWGSTEYDSERAFHYNLWSGGDDSYRGLYRSVNEGSINSKEKAYSCRCLKD